MRKGWTVAAMQYTAWTNPGIVFSSVGGGQAWTNPTNVGGTPDLARATLPASTSWSSSQVLFPSSGTIDWTSILPADAIVQEIWVQFYTQAAGILTGPPYRTWNLYLSTSLHLLGTAKTLDLNSQGGGQNWRTLGGSLASWGTDLAGISSWLTDGAAAMLVTNGNSSGTIGLDAMQLRLGYTLPMVSGVLSRSNAALRVGVGISIG